MTILFGLAPLLILGAIAWAVVGIVRQRATEPFTLASATSLYAHLLLLIGGGLLLMGLATAVKVGLGYADIHFSYFKVMPPIGCPFEKCGPGPDPDFILRQRSQDLVLAVTLTAVGLVVFSIHLWLARAVRRLAGGAPQWITRGSLVAATIVTGLAGLAAAAFALYAVLNYFLVGGDQGRQPFGEPLGMALAFVPAWVVLTTSLLRATQGPSPQPAPLPS